MYCMVGKRACSHGSMVLYPGIYLLMMLYIIDSLFCMYSVYFVVKIKSNINYKKNRVQIKQNSHEPYRRRKGFGGLL